MYKKLVESIITCKIFEYYEANNQDYLYDTPYKYECTPVKYENSFCGINFKAYIKQNLNGYRYKEDEITGFISVTNDVFLYTRKVDGKVIIIED